MRPIRLLPIHKKCQLATSKITVMRNQLWGRSVAFDSALLRQSTHVFSDMIVGFSIKKLQSGNPTMCTLSGCGMSCVDEAS